MAVQLNYLSPKGWKPQNPDQDYILVSFKAELARGVPNSKFKDAAATVAAESSTGTWTNVYSGPGSGMDLAEKYRAMVYDVDAKNKMFKVAYPLELFEMGNMSGFLAGPLGNVAGMKMLAGLRIFDIRFPESFVRSFPGPRYGIAGFRKLLSQNESDSKMPLLGTVPKPKIGRTDNEQAMLAEELFSAGDSSYNFVKDDENLTSLGFSNFYERARKVLSVINHLEKKNNRKYLYMANTSHSNLDEVLRRAKHIKQLGGRVMMVDVVTTGFAALHYLRLKNPGLFLYAHRAMHGFITRESGAGVSGKGSLNGFSVSMLVLAKIYRLLGVDAIHTGSPKSKMEDYGEAKLIADTIRESVSLADENRNILGQEWYGTNSVWPVASGGLHPSELEKVIRILGPDIMIQLGGGVLGHPEGPSRGVEAALQARSIVARGGSIRTYVQQNPDSALGVATKKWGFEPKVVY